MSLHTCLNCKELGMTWYVDDDNRTWWNCSLCEFGGIEEDESKECCCAKCDFPLPSVSWLIKDGEEFYWCFNCNDKTEQVKECTIDYQALIIELEKMNL